MLYSVWWDQLYMAQHRIFSSHQTSQYLFVFVTTGVCICVCISFNTIRWDKYHMAKDIHQTSPLIFTCLYLSLCLNLCLHLCLHLCLYLCFVFVFVRNMKSVPAFAAQIKRHPWKTYLIKIPQNSDKSDKTRKQIDDKSGRLNHTLQAGEKLQRGSLSYCHQLLVTFVIIFSILIGGR